MTKKELIRIVSEKSGVTQKDAVKVLDAILEAVTDVLIARDKIQFLGFGTFETRQRKARKGRNPRKPGEEIDIEASIAPVFKASKTLKNNVNK